MKKLLIVGTMLLVSALFIGTLYFPNAPLMWLAGTSIGYEVLRGVAIVLLGTLLFSNPPRALYIRYTIGASAAVLGIATTVLAVTYAIQLIDTIVFMEVAVIFGIEALELPVEQTVKATKQLKRSIAK